MQWKQQCAGVGWRNDLDGVGEGGRTRGLYRRGHMRQLKQHIGYALNLGISQREICEVFSQAGWYRGWPYVEEALEQAKSVFEEKGGSFGN